MSNNNMKMFLTLTVLAIMALSCSKEKGCTDVTAKNYLADATQDDGSCVFPTLTDNITGDWSMTRHKIESKDSSGFNLIAIEETLIGSASYNQDGTGLFTTDSTNAFSWTIVDDKIHITTDSLTLIYTVKTNTINLYIYI